MICRSLLSLMTESAARLAKPTCFQIFDATGVAAQATAVVAALGQAPTVRAMPAHL
jgi:hypothetical protein